MGHYRTKKLSYLFFLRRKGRDRGKIPQSTLKESPPQGSLPRCKIPQLILKESPPQGSPLRFKMKTMKRTKRTRILLQWYSEIIKEYVSLTKKYVSLTKNYVSLLRVLCLVTIFLRKEYMI
jgi:hypothetical protein